jgi:hypothetical protein
VVAFFFFGTVSRVEVMGEKEGFQDSEQDEYFDKYQYPERFPPSEVFESVCI